MSDNKFDITGSWGDVDSTTDSSGTFQNQDKENDPSQVAPLRDPGPSNKTNKDLVLEPNKFPRETGHDSLSPEEAQLS